MMKTKDLFAAIAVLPALASCGGTDKEISAEDIILEETEFNMAVGETRQIHAEILPQNTTDTILLFDSSAPDIASVSEDGLVTALSEGEAAIRVSAGEKHALCNVTVQCMPAEIGDYYYSDGTWSSELDADKTVIGIVFWAGDPGQDDPSLKKDHPECTHGLAVAVNGEQESGWQPYYVVYGKSVGGWLEENTSGYQSIIAGTEQESTLNMMVGYNNTKAIEVFNAAPENATWPVEAVEKAVQYRQSVPAPENSSDWYLPSAKELTLLAYGDTDKNIYYTDSTTVIKELVNEKLSTLEDSQLLCTHDFIWTYWAANEFDEEEAYNVSMMSGATFYYKKGVINYFARFILAF